MPLSKSVSQPVSEPVSQQQYLPLRQQGFSLLEMLIVIGLMSVAAAIALSSVDNNDNQRRFDETRAKLRNLQTAIIGSSDVIGDAYSVSGFVADMGRLPNDIRELLAQPDDCDKDQNGDQSCNWGYDSNTETWGGWHGPYLSNVLSLVDSDTAHSSEYDSWGNPWHLLDNEDDTIWAWSDAITGELRVASIGLDADYSNNDLEDTAQESYADSDLQLFILQRHQYLKYMPHESLQTSILMPPEFGQCVDTDDSVSNQGDCEAVSKRWDSFRNQCVDDDYDTPEDCEVAGYNAGLDSYTYTWAAIYGHCEISDGTVIHGVVSEDSCSAIGMDWETVVEEDANIDDSGSEFIPDALDRFCIRPIHRRHGVITEASYRSKNDPENNKPTADPEHTGDALVTYSASIETDESSPQDYFYLPLGQFRLGLYIHDGTECTTDPYPSFTAQGRSDVITLGHSMSPNIGTSANPIIIDWRSH